MKRISLTIIILFSFVNTFAQNVSISSFKLLDNDLTANTSGTMEQDQNGEIAALIKVVTTQTGFTFDGGSMGIVKTKQTPGEIWVYIPRGSKKISIKHPQLGVLRDYYYPVAIEAARTYEMILATGEVQTIVKEKVNSQYIVIKVSPANAIVELNNEILPTSNGCAQKFVKFGSYQYRVQAQNYHTAAGIVTVNDPHEKRILEVNLQPAFGWIDIPSHTDYNGAQVFIDNTLAGTIPMKSKNLPSGTHSIKIVKELYNPFTQNVEIKDNETTTITPFLSPNYSEITITVDNDADIYINEEKIGVGVWNGKLAPGSYIFEAKKEGHKNTRKIIEVSNQKQEIKLDSPTPIYGQANITSNPSFSEVYIDDKSVGQTPLFLPEILIGNHHIKIQHNGYEDYSSSIFISESGISNFDLTLIDKKMAKVDFRCNVPDAIIYIDDINLGIVDNLKQIQPGTHNIKVISEGFKDYEFTAYIQSGISDNQYNIKMIPDKSIIKRKKKKRK